MGIWQTFLETNLGLFSSKPNMVSVHMLLKITNECTCSTFLLLSAKRSALHPSDKFIRCLNIIIFLLLAVKWHHGKTRRFSFLFLTGSACGFAEPDLPSPVCETDVTPRSVIKRVQTVVWNRLITHSRWSRVLVKHWRELAKSTRLTKHLWVLGKRQAGCHCGASVAHDRFLFFYLF